MLFQPRPETSLFRIQFSPAISWPIGAYVSQRSHLRLIIQLIAFAPHPEHTVVTFPFESLYPVIIVPQFRHRRLIAFHSRISLSPVHSYIPTPYFLCRIRHRYIFRLFLPKSIFYSLFRKPDIFFQSSSVPNSSIMSR